MKRKQQRYDKRKDEKEMLKRMNSSTNSGVGVYIYVKIPIQICNQTNIVIWYCPTKGEPSEAHPVSAAIQHPLGSHAASSYPGIA
jgi:hypothetical protein